MEKFSKPLRKQASPELLDAFASGATHPFPQLAEPALTSTVPTATATASRKTDLESELALLGITDESEEVDPEIYGTNVRFTAREKALIRKLALTERRSQHQIIKHLMAPGIAQALASLQANPPVALKLAR